MGLILLIHRIVLMKSNLPDPLQMLNSTPFLTSPLVACKTPSTRAEDTPKTIKHCPSVPHVTLQNIKFEPTGERQNNGRKMKRIHGKPSIKHMEKCLLRPKSKQKNGDIKEEVLSKAELTNRIKQSQQRLFRKIHGKFAVETIQPDPRQLDQELKSIISQKKLHRPTHTHTRTSSNPQNFSSQIVFTQQTATVEEKQMQCLQGKTADFIFKQVKQKLQGEQQYMQKRARKSNCFYTNLKKKLELQIRKIEDKKEIDKTNFIVEGCHMQRHSRNSHDKKVMTDRSRPKTALTRTGLQLKLTANDNSIKRPQSCRSQILERKQLRYMKQKAINLFHSPKQRRSCPANRKQSDKENYSTCQPQFSKTLRHISPLYKQRNPSSSRSKIHLQRSKQKMLKILINCHKQSDQQSNVQEGMRVFSYFCKKMDNGLEKASHLLYEVQNNQPDEYAEQFI